MLARPPPASPFRSWIRQPSQPVKALPMNSLRSALTGWPAWRTETDIWAKPAYESASGATKRFTTGASSMEVNSVAGCFIRFSTSCNIEPISAYNGLMPLQVGAIYENGVLRPLQPLNLMEHERVLVSVVQTAASGRSSLALEYIERIRREQQGAEPAPGHRNFGGGSRRFRDPWPLKLSLTAGTVDPWPGTFSIRARW